jgi:hypothetical protein
MKLEPVLPRRDPWRPQQPRRSPRWRVPSTAWLAIGALALVAVLVVNAVPLESQPFASRVAILVVGLAAAWRVLGRAARITASSPERFEDVLRPRRVPPFEIPGLRAVETDIRMSTANAFGLEFRLKPVLRELAQWRLQREHGIDLDRQPDASRRVLGESLWPLIQAADAFPEFRDPGIPLADVQAGVERLEGI